MRSHRDVSVLLATVLVVAACTEGPTAPGTVDPSFAISDGAHDGNEYFFFLPPMVPEPTTSGAFDGGWRPVVTIHDLDTSAEIAAFTMDTGPGSETVRVGEDHYIVNWHTDDFGLDDAHTYRITVSIDGWEFGFADVDVVTTGRELKNVQTGEYIALKDGRTLPIKFRIDEGAMVPLAASAVAAGARHACAIGANLTTYCWGGNEVGQLGAGTTEASNVPVPVSGGHLFNDVSSGFNHTCGLKGSGEVWCWGRNPYGQLGDGTIANSDVPVRAAPGLAFQSVDVGTYHTCGISTDGTAYCWGANGPLLQNIGGGVPLPHGFVQAFGTATTMMCPATNPNYRGAEWYCSPTPVEVPGSFTSISAGLWSSCGLTTTGAAYCTGYDGLFQIGDDIWYNSPTMVPLAGGLSFDFVDQGSLVGCGIADTEAYCWGGFFVDNGVTGDGTMDNLGNGTPQPVFGGLAFASIQASDANNIWSHACGLTTTAEAFCWGNNGRGELGTQATLETCARPGGGGMCSSKPVPVAGPNQFTGISTGGRFTCGVRDSGHVYCWGSNGSGQLGDGTLSDRFTPVQVLRGSTP